MTSRGSSRRLSADADRLDAARIGAWLVVILLVPRVLRMLYSEIWVEDDFYLESAWLVSVGMRPYLDFVHPHMPLLEWIAAGYLKLFGASYRSIEFLNEAAIFVTSLLTFSLARRVAARPAAIAASILYAYSSLAFRYHAYERECFVAPLLMLAAIVTLDDTMPALRQAVALAAIFFFACAIKLTAVIPFPVMLLFILIAYRRLAAPFASGVIFTLALAAFTALLYWLYGNEFIFQTFIFHFMKGRDTALNIAMFPRMVLDILAPLLVLGIIRLISERAFSRGIVLVIAIVAVEYAFYGALSPTAWAHNYLEALPFIAIVAAVGLMSVIAPVRAYFTGEAGPHEWMLIAGRVALIVIFLAWITPIVNDSWLHGAIYGFGYVPRAEALQISEALRAASKPGDEVIAPSFICFEANRRELVRYPETYGVYREAKAEFDREGFFAARRRLGSVDFFDLISDTRHYWTDQMRAAILSGKVSAVVNDSPLQLFPLVLVPEDFLVSQGFRPTLETDHFALWTRPPASAPAPSPPAR